MMEEKLYFSTIKEGRDEYFVEYRPPVHKFQFATLQLTYTKDVDLELVADAMEIEAGIWLARFPLPLMVSAFNSYGGFIYLNGVRPENSLLAFRNSDTGSLEYHWRLLKNEEIPADALNRDLLLKVYSKVERKTASELRAKAETYARSNRIGWYVVFLWIAVAPAAFLVLEYFGPEWLAALVFIYGLSQALIKALKMLGKWRKSPAEIAKDEDERRMRHHHYHCERNPEGFLRIKLENFQKEQREQILREAESLSAGKSEAD